MLHYFLYGFMRLQLAYSLKWFFFSFHTFFSPLHVALWERHNNVYELEQLRPFMHTMLHRGMAPCERRVIQFPQHFHWLKLDILFRSPRLICSGWLFYQRHTFFVHTFPLGMIIFLASEHRERGSTRKFIFVILVVQHKNHGTYVMMPSQRFTNFGSFTARRLFLIILSQVSTPENLSVSAAERIGVKKSDFPCFIFVQSRAKKKRWRECCLLGYESEQTN